MTFVCLVPRFDPESDPGAYLDVASDRHCLRHEKWCIKCMSDSDETGSYTGYSCCSGNGLNPSPVVQRPGHPQMLPARSKNRHAVTHMRTFCMYLAHSRWMSAESLATAPCMLARAACTSAAAAASFADAYRSGMSVTFFMRAVLRPRHTLGCSSIGRPLRLPASHLIRATTGTGPESGIS